MGRLEKYWPMKIRAKPSSMLHCIMRSKRSAAVRFTIVPSPSPKAM